MSIIASSSEPDDSENLQSEESKKIKEAIQLILDNPILLEKLIGAKEKEQRRRVNYSRLSNLPYYTKRFALELRAVVDDMIQRGVDKEYIYADYPDLSHKTIYLRVNQSKLFLLDNLDPDDKYRDTFQKICITQEGTGVRLSLRKEASSMSPKDISLDEKKSEWQEKMTNYLENAKVGDEPLRLVGLSLTAEEVEIQKESFINIPGISAFITPTEIMLVKFEEGSK